MTVTELASMGYACGLETLGEAHLMMELHWDALTQAQWTELAFSLLVHRPDMSRRCADVLGREECARQDREMQEFFDAIDGKGETQ